MSNILDIYSDRSLRGLVDLLRKNTKHAQELMTMDLEYSDCDRLPETAFAWPEERSYPIHNKKMAMLSAMYRVEFPPKDKTIPSHVDSALTKAAYLYDFKMPHKKKLSTTKVASASSSNPSDQDYLLPELKKFPVRDAKEAKLVENILVKNAHVMGYDHLTEACHRLIEKMASFKMTTEEVNPIVYKYAGLTLSNKEFLTQSIERRLDFAPDDKKEGYRKLASIVDDMDFNRTNLVKVASTLEEMDKQANVRRLYDKYVPNPIESVFNTMKPRTSSMSKTASEEIFTPDMAHVVSEEQVRNILGEDVLQEAMGKDGMDPGQLVAVINSLPRDMVKDFIERVA